MRSHIPLFALTLCATLTAAWGQEKAIAIAFGPASAGAGQTAATLGATRIHDWLQSRCTAVELRRTGIREGQELLKFMQTKELESALADAARLAAAAPLDRFLDMLELAVSAVSRQQGARFVVIAPELTPSNDDLAYRLKQIAEACKSKNVQILIWDLGATPPAEPGAWQALAASSGGALARDFPQLEAKFLAAAAPAAATTGVPKPDDGSVVRVALFRGAPASAKRSGSTVDVMAGLFLTEVPMASLHFSTQGSNAEARVRIKQAIKGKGGETVWEYGKDLAVKSPVSRLDARKRGSLCYVRQVQLAKGEYTLESTVEDLVLAKSVTGKAALTATDSLPGLAASGMLFARKLNRQIDLFEGDTVIQYDGTALMPMLDPVFPANEPFELSVYFLFYPDMNGKRPQLRLDVLQNGQTVGGMDLAFTDTLRDDTRSGRGATPGEQKHEFPYLARLANAMLLAGQYEVKLTIRQDTQQVTRSAGFRVVEGLKEK